MKEMHFGYIAPIEYLHLIPDSSRFHLILAHLLKYEAYAKFYRAKADEGDMIIVDNSAFEFKRPVEASELITMISDSGVKPTYVVAPDYPFDKAQKTIDSAFDFVEKCKSHDFKIMAVPQSEYGDWRGWCMAYQQFVNSPNIGAVGMSILGIPNAFATMTKTKDIAFNRIYATQFILQNQLHDSRYRTWHHYLGLGNGPRELLMQRQLGLIDSNDSSSVFWHAIHGIAFDDSATGLVNGKLNKEVDFHLPFNPVTQKTITHNINWINENIMNYDANSSANLR